MNTITLNNGVKMPQMGYGVYQVSPAECERSWGPFAEGLNDFFHNELLTEIGKAHGKTLAQTALRFLIQRGVIIIPKSTHKERMQENLDIFDFELTSDEMARIAALDLKHSLFFSHYEPKMVKQFMLWGKA